MNKDLQKALLMISLTCEHNERCFDCPFHFAEPYNDCLLSVPPNTWDIKRIVKALTKGQNSGYKDTDSVAMKLQPLTKWEQIDNEPDTFFTIHKYKCSNCGKIQLAKSKNIKNYRYCSKCGADMR